MKHIAKSIEPTKAKTAMYLIVWYMAVSVLPLVV